MKSYLVILSVLFAGIAFPATVNAQARHRGSQPDTAQAVLGIINGALNNQAGGGQWGSSGRQGNRGGSSFGNNNNFGTGWTTTRPQYGYQNQVMQNGRWYNENDPRVRQQSNKSWQRTYQSGNTTAVLGGDDRVEPPRRRVRVQTGTETQVNVAKVIGDAVGLGAQIARQVPPPARRPAINYNRDDAREYYQVYDPAPRYETVFRQTPAAVKPVPELQRNVLPDLPLDPVGNDAPLFALADDGQLQQAMDELHDQAVRNADKLARQQNKRIEATLNGIEIPADADQNDIQNFANAVAAKDVDSIRELGQKIGLDEKKLADLVEEVKVGQSLDRLADMVVDGASAEEIDQVASGLGTYLSTKPGDESTELQEQLASLSTTVRARDAIASALESQVDDAYPPGMADLITVPELPADTIAVTPEGQIIQGTGGIGELGIAQGTVADVIGVSVPSSDPTPDVDDGTVDSITSGVVLLSKKENRADIHYRVDNHDFTMKPGYRQILDAGYAHLIEFDRGGDFGTVKYQLTEGSYYFDATSKGWELYRKTHTVTIDNSQNKYDFHYIINDEQTVVKAGQQQQHKSDYPIVVRFDRGDGKDPGCKRLNSGTYHVGLDIKNRRIELFGSEEQILYRLRGGMAGQVLLGCRAVVMMKRTPLAGRISRRILPAN